MDYSGAPPHHLHSLTYGDETEDDGPDEASLEQHIGQHVNEYGQSLHQLATKCTGLTDKEQRQVRFSQSAQGPDLIISPLYDPTLTLELDHTVETQPRDLAADPPVDVVPLVTPWNSAMAEVADYEELLERKDEITELLQQQGEGEHLQAYSHKLIDESLKTKQPSWATLLRRCLHLYTHFCNQRRVPVFPICAPKVALYLSRMDLDDANNAGNGDDDDMEEGVDAAASSDITSAVAAALKTQDLAVSGDALDPALRDRLYPLPLPLPPAKRVKRSNMRGGSVSGAKPKKVLKRKTLEQYVNRLTALRAPTFEFWLPRTGGASARDTGLGTAPVIRDILERAGGESAVEVKKRSRIKREAEGRAAPRKRARKGANAETPVKGAVPPAANRATSELALGDLGVSPVAKQVRDAALPTLPSLLPDLPTFGLLPESFEAAPSDRPLSFTSSNATPDILTAYQPTHDSPFGGFASLRDSGSGDFVERGTTPDTER